MHTGGTEVYLHPLLTMILGHGSPTSLCQRGSPIIVGWFAGFTWKNNSKKSDSLNYCVIFVLCTQCSNVTVGHIIQPGRQLVGEPCTIWRLVFYFTSWLPCSWGIRPQYPLNGRLGGLQSWSGCFESRVKW